MSEIIRDTIQTARKPYPCDACFHWKNSGYGQNNVNAEDWLVVENARADDWKILPGQKYRKQIYRDDDALVTYRARLDMNAVCQRYGLFDE